MTTDNPQTRPRLGFIGTGGMGSRMAARLLDSGYEVTVYNRHRERTQPLAQRGAKVAATPAELAAGVDVVLSSVADDAAVEAVMLGADGALRAARADTVFIEMSTVSPRISRRLYEMARPKSVHVLDAPVSGTIDVAERGQLVIFVGGDEPVYERCRPILSVLGKESFYMGPSGSGATMKLCANTLLGIGVQALAEAIVLGLKGGLRRERLVEVLGDTMVVSPSQKSKLQNVLAGTYRSAFPLRLMFKDFRLILNTASELPATMPITAVAQQICAVEYARQSATGVDEDFSSVIRTMEELARVSDTEKKRP
ncbi:MAG: NAD(P)-dependent oxidoreductase [Burkholderiales bacterium]